MANIQDIIASAVKSNAGGIEIPENLKEKALGGLSDSIFGSLTQTVTKAGGVDQIKNLLTGKQSAASSPITALAGNIFKGNASKLGLSSVLTGALGNIIPTVMGKLSGILSDKDGDGDVDFQDILLTLNGGSSAGAAKKSGSGILGAATSILGGILKKK